MPQSEPGSDMPPAVPSDPGGPDGERCRRRAATGGGTPDAPPGVTGGAGGGRSCAIQACEASDVPGAAAAEPSDACSFRLGSTKWRLLWLLPLLLFALEGLLKYVARKHELEFQLISLPFLDLHLHWTYSENRSSCMGILHWLPQDLRNVLYVFLGTGLLGFTIWVMTARDKHRMLRYGTWLMLWGGVGNLVDRYLVGCVIDYLRVEFFGSALNFNLSDCVIDAGLGVLLVHLYQSD